MIRDRANQDKKERHKNFHAAIFFTMQVLLTNTNSEDINQLERSNRNASGIKPFDNLVDPHTYLGFDFEITTGSMNYQRAVFSHIFLDEIISKNRRKS